MKMDESNLSSKDALIEELIQQQQKHLLDIGRKLVPTLTREDVLQPNDYLVLENDPIFRYEEGILAGLQSAQMAWKAAD